MNMQAAQTRYAMTSELGQSRHSYACRTPFGATGRKVDGARQIKLELAALPRRAEKLGEPDEEVRLWDRGAGAIEAAHEVLFPEGSFDQLLVHLEEVEVRHLALMRGD
jgi:hypothetical protein